VGELAADSARPRVMCFYRRFIPVSVAKKACKHLS
jgi:hypothetical protein